MNIFKKFVSFANSIDTDTDEEVFFTFKMDIESSDGYFRLDRKSTRLNSSHGYISYAVFCLKKKKKTEKIKNRKKKKQKKKQKKSYLRQILPTQ